MIVRWFDREELAAWVQATWGFAKQISPLLLGGIVVSGWLMGRPGSDAGLIPSSWVSVAVGGNSVAANLIASVAGAFMYFATLTEVPILQTLLGSGMGEGPALALLLAGPALSLPHCAQARYELAQVEQARGNRDEAMRLYESCLRVGPSRSGETGRGRCAPAVGGAPIRTIKAARVSV